MIVARGLPKHFAKTLAVNDLSCSVTPGQGASEADIECATLAARSAVPTEVRFDLQARPTQAIEAIAYYCVAELLANVAQHAHASRASVSCAQQGTWLRLVVRDDGRGGAQASTIGSASSGLSGLVDRVRTVDGQFTLVSPIGGPTVVTIDLPLAV